MSEDRKTTISAHPWCSVLGPEDNGKLCLTGFDNLHAEDVTVHIERMDRGIYWMVLRKGTEEQRIEFWTRGRLCSGTEIS
jgi:hypothetical protein